MLIDEGGKKSVLEQGEMGLRGEEPRMAGQSRGCMFFGLRVLPRESGMDRTKNSFYLWELCRRGDMKVSQVLNEM